MSVTLHLFDPGNGSGRSQPADTIGWYAAKYRDNLILRAAGGDYSPRRLKVTLSYLARFLDYSFAEPDGGAPPVRLADLTLAEARQLHLTSWLLGNYAHWKKGSTRQDALGSVLGAFNWLEEQGLIAHTPFRRPKKLSFPRVHHRAMRREHYRAVVRVARLRPMSKPFREIFFASWHAGVRLIEFRQLEPHEIDWANSVVRIPPEKHKTGKKTAETRIVGIGPRLLAVLRGLVDRMKPGQRFVFLGPRGKPWTKDNLGRHFFRYRALAAVPPEIKLCAVRHGYAVRVLADGVTSNKAVADQLGHKGTRMVDSIYGAETRYDAELVRNVAARAERGKRPAAAPRKPKAKVAQRPSLFDGLE